jgi:hypothetical protein
MWNGITLSFYNACTKSIHCCKLKGLYGKCCRTYEVFSRVALLCMHLLQSHWNRGHRDNEDSPWIGIWAILLGWKEMKSEVEKQCDVCISSYIHPFRHLNTYISTYVWQSDCENEETVLFVWMYTHCILSHMRSCIVHSVSFLTKRLKIFNT